jgi:hypothetical protein
MLALISSLIFLSFTYTHPLTSASSAKESLFFFELQFFILLSLACLKIENCLAATDYKNGGSNDEFISKLKATNSSYCLMRHNRSINQLRGNERSSSGANNVSYNFGSNNSNAMQDTDPSTAASSSSSSNRKQMVIFVLKLKLKLFAN